MIVHLDEYQQKTGTQHMRFIIRCTLFEAVALAMETNMADSVKYQTIWGKDFVSFDDFGEFGRKFGYNLNVWKTNTKNNELRWKLQLGLGWNEQSLDILVDDSWDLNNKILSACTSICWIRNRKIIKHIVH